MWQLALGMRTVIRIRTEEGAMDTPAFGPKLALPLAIASVLHLGAAQAQSSLQVYSDNFGGPNQSAPAGATRDTVISMSVPRLHAVLARLRRVENILATHPIPPHDHPHTHPVKIVTIIIDGVPEQASVDTSGQVTVASRPGLSFNVDTVAPGTLVTVMGPNNRPVTFEVPADGTRGPPLRPLSLEMSPPTPIAITATTNSVFFTRTSSIQVLLPVSPTVRRQADLFCQVVGRHTPVFRCGIRATLIWLRS